MTNPTIRSWTLLGLLTLAVGCGGKALDGGSTQGGTSGSPNGGGSGTATFDKPVGGTIAGQAFVPRSVELQYAKYEGATEGQWFLTLRNFAETCGTLPDPRPDPATSMLVTVGAVAPAAGDQAITYGDGHAATFQLGVYEATGPKPITRSAVSGVVHLDTWNGETGAVITGGIRLEGEDSAIEGTFTATVCAPR